MLPLRAEPMAKKWARPGNPLRWGLYLDPGLVEFSHVAPSPTYLLAAAPGKPLPRPALVGRGRAGLVLLRHALGPRLRTVPGRALFGHPPGPAPLRPAQTPRRVLQGGLRQVRRP